MRMIPGQCLSSRTMYEVLERIVAVVREVPAEYFVLSSSLHCWLGATITPSIQQAPKSQKVVSPDVV